MADAYWNTGAITLVTNSPDVVGQDTDFLGSTARAGDTIESDDGRRATIASINSATSITLDKPWRGTGQSAAAYKIWFTPDDVTLEGLGRRALSNLSSGILTAFSGLTSAANKLPFFTGAGTMSTTDLGAKGIELIGTTDGAAARTAIGAISVDDLSGKLDVAGGNIGANAAAFRNNTGTNDASNLTGGTLPNGRVSQTLDPTRAFRRGNILGAVGQTGGVPNGALSTGWIENASGWYKRDADGTQVCICRLVFDMSSNAFQGITFPAAFVNNDYAASIRFARNPITGTAPNWWAGARNVAFFEGGSAIGISGDLLMRTDLVAATGVIVVTITGRWF